MTRRRVGPVLAEILEAINGIETHTAGLSLTDFQQNWLLKLAVQRALEIVSEASRHLSDDLLELAPDVPWKQIWESAIFCVMSTTRSRMMSFGPWSPNMCRRSKLLLRLSNDPSKVKTEDLSAPCRKCRTPPVPCCSSGSMER